MKKIYHDIAIEALILITRPNTHITVIDRKNMYDNGKIVFSNECHKLCHYDYAKIVRSRIRDLYAEDDKIIITIETCNEDF